MVFKQNQNDTVSSCKKDGARCSRPRRLLRSHRIRTGRLALPHHGSPTATARPPPQQLSSRSRRLQSRGWRPSTPTPSPKPERDACRSARTGRKASRRVGLCSDVTRPPHRPCIYVSPASSAPTQPSPAHTEARSTLHAPRGKDGERTKKLGGEEETRRRRPNDKRWRTYVGK
jgi:hypothetical protein